MNHFVDLQHEKLKKQANSLANSARLYGQDGQKEIVSFFSFQEESEKKHEQDLNEKWL